MDNTQELVNNGKITIKHVIFTVDDRGHLVYVDDPKWNDLLPYNFPKDIRKAKMYDTAEEAIDVVRGISVYPFYVRSIAIGFANDGIV